MLTRSDLHVPPLSPHPSLLHSGISQLSLDQVILVSSSVLSPSTWLPTPFSNLKSCCAPSQARSRGHLPAPHLLLPPTSSSTSSSSLLSPSLQPSLLYPACCFCHGALGFPCSLLTWSLSSPESSLGAFADGSSNSLGTTGPATLSVHPYQVLPTPTSICLSCLLPPPLSVYFS